MADELAKLIPRTGMLAFYRGVAGESANNSCLDYSGNGRNLSCSLSGAPVFTLNALNGQPGWYFDGTSNPLVYTGSVSPKYVFLVASFDETTFTGYRGLLTGPASGNVLVTNNSGDKFFDFGSGSAYTYRKSDVIFSNADQKAPVSDIPAIIEVSHTTGFPLDGFQIGQQLADGSRKHLGFVYAVIAYDRIPNDAERFELFAWAAMTFQLWRKTSAGFDVFPFQPNWAEALATDKLVLSSTSVNGAIKARSKSVAKDALELQFESRRVEEADAAYAFWNSKYPGLSFVYRDDAYSPPRDREVRFTSGFARKLDSYQDQSYGFTVFTSLGGDVPAEPLLVTFGDDETEF